MFFSKKDDLSQSKVVNEAITSIIGKDMTIIGDISFKGKTRLDGGVEGNIDGEYFILSQTGNVTGDINADTIICQGQINGNVKAKELSVKSGGTINGKVETTDLFVESGASLNGEVKSRTKDLRLVHGQGATPQDSSERQQEQTG